MSILRDFSEQEAKWMACGIYCGYPMCCILDFLERKFQSKDYYQLRVMNGEGFVPCPDCARRVFMSGATVASLILPHRVCPLPFPEDDVLERLQDGTLFTKLQAYYGTKVQTHYPGGGSLRPGALPGDDR